MTTKAATTKKLDATGVGGLEDLAESKTSSIIENGSWIKWPPIILLRQKQPQQQTTYLKDLSSAEDVASCEVGQGIDGNET